MEHKKKHIGLRITLGVLAAALIIALVAAPFVLERLERSGDVQASILSAAVTVDTITKTLSGTGTLTVSPLWIW